VPLQSLLLNSNQQSPDFMTEIRSTKQHNLSFLPSSPTLMLVRSLSSSHSWLAAPPHRLWVLRPTPIKGVVASTQKVKRRSFLLAQKVMPDRCCTFPKSSTALRVLPSSQSVMPFASLRRSFTAAAVSFCNCCSPTNPP
jgi:hypothetical protein